MENTGSAVRLPQLRLDELLDEVQARLDAARGTRDRVHKLLEAVLSVGRGLELEQVLRGIIDAAVVLVDARYGALGVIGPDGRRLSQFLTVGLTDEEIAAIGPYPCGHGILGELIRRPEPLRLPKIADHPASYGFPPGHPPMNTFLGVPIRVRDHVFGNLYLTEKRGGADFEDEDEEVLATLAVAAGIAIENARLYEESTRRERWLRAGAEVTTALMSDRPRAEVTARITALAREITGSDLAVFSLPEPGDDALTVEAATGTGADGLRHLVLPLQGTLSGTAFTDARPARGHAEEVPAGPAGPGPALAVPVTSGDDVVHGVLLLVRAAGAGDFAEWEAEPLLAFAGQTGLAMELAERRADTAQLALLEDRDRIARDLHDLAIQRLFATGMTLQSADRFIDHPEAAERVRRAVGDLDETIKIIRSTIFGLRSRETAPQHGLRTRAVRAVAEAGTALGFAPSLRMEGLLDTQVPREAADDAVAVLAEALANVARHAQAGAVDVAVVNEGGALVLTVADDGIGMPPTATRRSGLRNLSERAERHGGTLTLSTPPSGTGTHLEWRIPLTGGRCPMGHGTPDGGGAAAR
ncbi:MULTISPECIES: sensor histidine kinase [Streptomyces]|uniref:sensor histidine kinase n=1 Tax=Streptomyces TaxID=1883 RepID=UPI00163BFE15|nr:MULTISPECIES: GAF domain-containing protein [Streptomyces]MBC2878338.1 GAF domain-containing protein [Streptomyces sp. TYQ1024]UBI40544.1 GAF domain-containing protein [Streptomyces mobaraensis]UKW33126.1 GAF domain-containing protein [Streptomyces sp. TYQ1024]